MSITNESTVKSATIESYPDYLFFEDGSVWSHILNRFLIQDKLSDTGYYRVGVYNALGEHKIAYTHCLLALAFLGPRPNGLVVDHKDRDKTNNHISNLRYVTFSQNRRNSDFAMSATSKYTGVSYFKQTGKWRAAIVIDGKFIHLKYHKEEVEAAKAYDKMAVTVGREPNFPVAIATELLQIQN